MLTPDQLQRYARHLTLPEVGLAGQGRLQAARVLIIGAGGLGSPAALYLAAAGIGTLGIIDDDHVDLSNLQRQVLHGTAAVGTPKLESAAARLRDLNPHLRLELFPERLTSANARTLVKSFDIVLDGSDNFPTRYLVNDACVLEGIPFVYGSIYRFEGQLSLFGAPGGPCYRCLFAEPPVPELVPSCTDAGVLGVLPGIIGTLQALEAIKWILGIGENAVGRLLLFDALRLNLREIALRRDPGCAVCGDAPTIHELIDYEAFCGVRRSTDSHGGLQQIGPTELLAHRADAIAPIQLDVREPWEFEIAHIPGSILIPLAELPDRYTELPPGRRIVTICHKGMRSMQAAQLLTAMGFGDVASLEGGVDRWAEQVDPRLARY